MKLALSWRERKGVVERRIGDSAPIPDGPQGDAMIEEAVRAEVRRRRPAGVAVIIAPDRAVPWRVVVAAMDTAKDGGADKIEFARVDESEPRGEESRPSSRK